MKSIIKLFSVLIVLTISMFSFSSCSEDWEDVYLTIDQNNFNISNNGETKTISIQTNSDWKIVTKNASWINFDKTSGTGNSELQINVTRNTSNKRTGTITICAGTETAEIKVEQAAATTGTLSVTTGSCTIKREKVGTRYKYTITAQYNITGGHLASEAGIEFGNSASKTTGTIKDGVHTATAYVTSSSASYTVSYRAYAVRKSTGAKVYGTTKTKKY